MSCSTFIITARGSRQGLFAAAVVICLECAMSAVPDFEASPAPAQTTPRPADGEVAAANPPAFVYPAAKAFPAYVVE
jgi:hypothetical protein